MENPPPGMQFCFKCKGKGTLPPEISGMMPSEITGRPDETCNACNGTKLIKQFLIKCPVCLGITKLYPNDKIGEGTPVDCRLCSNNGYVDCLLIPCQKCGCRGRIWKNSSKEGDFEWCSECEGKGFQYGKKVNGPELMGNNSALPPYQRFFPITGMQPENNIPPQNQGIPGPSQPNSQPMTQPMENNTPQSMSQPTDNNNIPQQPMLNNPQMQNIPPMEGQNKDFPMPNPADMEFKRTSTSDFKLLSNDMIPSNQENNSLPSQNSFAPPPTEANNSAPPFPEFKPTPEQNNSTQNIPPSMNVGFPESQPNTMGHGFMPAEPNKEIQPQQNSMPNSEPNKMENPPMNIPSSYPSFNDVNTNSNTNTNSDLPGGAMPNNINKEIPNQNNPPFGQ
ncbi:MAG: hypothetical protein MJ252_16675, partial [archaeon]|nr:hypothetical protein [archaeon]